MALPSLQREETICCAELRAVMTWPPCVWQPARNAQVARANRRMMPSEVASSRLNTTLRASGKSGPGRALRLCIGRRQLCVVLVLRVSGAVVALREGCPFVGDEVVRKAGILDEVRHPHQLLVLALH